MRLKNLQKRKVFSRVRRHARVRAKISGTAARPRLSVFRSAKHISAQLIDDNAGKTVAAATDLDLKKQSKGKIDPAAEVGKLIAERALAKKIKSVVFDRGGYAYHGRVKALADGARAGGLEF